MARTYYYGGPLPYGRGSEGSRVREDERALQAVPDRLRSRDRKGAGRTEGPRT